MSSKLRIGIVGAGSNVRRRHLPDVRLRDDVEVVAVANRNLESSKRAARDLQIPMSYGSWYDIVHADDIDAVLVGTWPDGHAEITIAALESGKHVLTEARMARDAQEAKRMLSVSKSHPELIARVVPSPLATKADPTIRRLLAEGDIGDVLAVDASLAKDSFINYERPLHWRENSRYSGLNVMELGILYETLMRWVGGARWVMAMGKVNVASRIDPDTRVPETVQLPDHLHVLMEFDGEAIASLQLSSVTGFAPAKSIWVYATNGTIAYDVGSEALKVGYRGQEGLTPLDIPSAEHGRWRAADDFIDAIRGVEPTDTTSFEDGVRYMEFVDSVWRSFRTGCREPVPCLVQDEL